MAVYWLQALRYRDGKTITQAFVRNVRNFADNVLSSSNEKRVVVTKAIGLAGFKTIITQFSDKSLLNIFHYVKRHAPFPHMGFKIQKADNGEYIVTVNLGDVHKGKK